MTNPQAIACDADALIQIFLAGKLAPLQVLKQRFGVQPLIVPEVEIEVTAPRFARQFGNQLKKSRSNGLLDLLDSTTFSKYMPVGGPGLGYADMQAQGAINYKHVDRGEAYTHAAGCVLRVPSLSNDLNAVLTMESTGLAIPTPVLRSFDLLALAFQTQALTLKECEEFRKSLIAQLEHIPKSFQNASFEAGLGSFVPRILDASMTPVGAAPNAAFRPYAQQMFLSPLVSP